ADRVAEWKQPARECFEPLEVPPKASRKAEAGDVAEAFGVSDRVVKGRGPELPHNGQKSIPVAWRFFAVPAADGHHPSAALQRQHQAAAAALPDVGNRPHRFPIGWG